MDKIDWEKWVVEGGYIPKDTITLYSREYEMTRRLAYQFIQFEGASVPKKADSFYEWDSDQYKNIYYL